MSTRLRGICRFKRFGPIDKGRNWELQKPAGYSNSKDIVGQATAGNSWDPGRAATADGGATTLEVAAQSYQAYPQKSMRGSRPPYANAQLGHYESENGGYKERACHAKAVTGVCNNPECTRNHDDAVLYTYVMNLQQQSARALERLRAEVNAQPGSYSRSSYSQVSYAFSTGSSL